MTDLEKRASHMKWDPPAPGTEARKEMPKTAFLSPSTRTYPYKVVIDGQWVVSEKGLRSVISVANFRGNSMISSRASKLLADLLKDEAKQSDSVIENFLSHHGILGMKWGQRRYQNEDGTRTAAGKRREEQRDIKWAKTKGAKVTAKTEKAVQKDIAKYEKKELSGVQKRTSEGKVSKTYMNQYNKKLAELMNEKVGNVAAPSGKVIKYVAKRGEIGVHTALADVGYDMTQVKNGVNAAGRIAYKKEVLKKG